MNLDIGTLIRYPDGEQVGSIHKVVFDPETAAVREIVLDLPTLVGRLVLVPVNRLRADPGGVITLDATREEVAEMSDYLVDRFMDPPDGWTMPANYTPGDGIFPTSLHYPVVPVFEESNAEEGTVEWSQDTEVVCSDGRFGTVDLVLVDDTGTLTGLVARADADETVRLLVPFDLIASADSQTIELDCTLAELPDHAAPYDESDTEPEPDTLVPND
jgi:hypothetical protein